SSGARCPTSLTTSPSSTPSAAPPRPTTTRQAATAAASTTTPSRPSRVRRGAASAAADPPRPAHRQCQAAERSEGQKKKSDRQRPMPEWEEEKSWGRDTIAHSSVPARHDTQRRSLPKAKRGLRARRHSPLSVPGSARFLKRDGGRRGRREGLGGGPFLCRPL